MNAVQLKGRVYMKKINVSLIILIFTIIISSCSASNSDTYIEKATTTPSDISTQFVSDTYNSVASENVTLYLPNSSSDGLITKDYECEIEAKNIVSKLVAIDALPEGSELNSISLIMGNNSESSPKSIRVDMNALFAAGIKRTGSVKEYLYMGSLVNTMLDYYDVDEMILTVAGETLETGNYKYDKPLTMYDNLIGMQNRLKTDFYVPNYTDNNFDVYSYQYDGTINGLIAKLVEVGSLPEGTTVNTFVIENNVLHIDLSTTYGKAVASNETTGEYMLVGSLVNTLIKCYGVESVSFTVDGNTVVAGHNTYDWPISFFENNNCSTD